MMAEKPAGTSAKPMAKSALFKELATKTGLETKQVASVFAALDEVIHDQLGKKGPGLFVVPGLVKFKLVRKPPTKETVKPNPFKPGEMMTVAAKPASVKVKAVILKGLKEVGK
jgi:nucleoid DNA-binding protein